MNLLRGRLTFANVMSVIAVFLALSGIGYAAFRLPKNSVGPKQIRNGAVNEAKLSASAKAALKGLKGDQGPPGPGRHRSQPRSVRERPSPRSRRLRTG